MAMYLGDKPVKVIERGKNLLNIFGRTEAEYDDEFGSSVSRAFDESKYYVGISSNNYWAPPNVSDLSMQNGAIVFTTTASGYGLGFPVKCEPNKQYYLSFLTDGNIGFGFFDSVGGLLSFTEGYTVSHGITTPDNCYWLLIVITGGGGHTVISSRIMLNEGDTELPYEPYNLLLSAPIKKCVGKNLFDISQANVTVDGEYFGTAVDYDRSFYNMRVIPGKTYTVSASLKTNATEGLGSKLSMSVGAGKDTGYPGNRIKTLLLDRFEEYVFKLTFTVPDNVTWVSLNTLRNTHTFKDFMINEGDTALPYEPYTEWYEY